MLDLCKTTVKVDGEELTVDLIAEIASKDIPKRISIAGVHLGRAVRQQRRLRSEYRKERASYYTSELKKDSKLAEWKLKARWESSEQFSAYKEAEAVAEHATLALSALLDGLHAKTGIAYHPPFPTLPLR